MKEDILNEYQQGYGAKYSKPVTTTSLGTSPALQPPSHFVLMKRSVMKPDPKKHYIYGPIFFGNVLALIMNSFLSAKDMLSIALTCIFFRKVVPETKILLLLDWGPILQPRLDYESQTHIDPRRVDMATALAIISGFDPGKIVRTLGGEYTGACIKEQH